MRVDRFDNGDEYWTVESTQDFHDWRILWMEPRKDNVVRLWCRRRNCEPPEFCLLYCPGTILDEIDEVGPVQ